ncbi:hypothetical protein DVH05_004863 [Phytophthora capsici]|nr:hypothetical protein DVH05_004863 [Phytophthora capsici]
MARSRTKRTLNEAFSAIDQVSSGLPVSASRRHARQRETRLSAAGTTETRVSRRVSARIAACERKQEIDSASDSSDDHEYEVEDILKEKDGLFFVKWLGYGSDENTWEPEENLKLETVQRFRRRLGLPTAPLREQETCNALRIDSNEEHANQSGYESSTVDATDLVGAHVSFSPEKESWMPRGEYQAVGTTYLTGIVARIFKGKGRKKRSPLPLTTFCMKFGGQLRSFRRSDISTKSPVLRS